MIYKTEGIVLKNSPYGEADLLVTFLTSDLGLVGAFAKSPRKVKSRFGSSLEPLTYSRVSFWGRENAALPRLTQSDIIKPFQAVRERMEVFFRVSGMLEITLRFLPEREPNGGAFRLLLDTLGLIEEGVEIGLCVLFYRVRLLGLSGNAPRLSGCARCGRESSAAREGIRTPFYLSHGSVLCPMCARGPESALRVSSGAVRLYESLRRWDASGLGRIRPAKTLVTELDALLDAHIEYTLSMPLRTKAARN